MAKVTLVLVVDSDSINPNLWEGNNNQETADVVAEEITEILKEASVSASVNPTHVDGEAL